jgi:hypothetical protein
VRAFVCLYMSLQSLLHVYKDAANINTLTVNLPVFHCFTLLCFRLTPLARDKEIDNETFIFMNR